MRCLSLIFKQLQTPCAKGISSIFICFISEIHLQMPKKNRSTVFVLVSGTNNSWFWFWFCPGGFCLCRKVMKWETATDTSTTECIDASQNQDIYSACAHLFNSFVVHMDMKYGRQWQIVVYIEVCKPCAIHLFVHMCACAYECLCAWFCCMQVRLHGSTRLPILPSVHLCFGICCFFASISARLSVCLHVSVLFSWLYVCMPFWSFLLVCHPTWRLSCTCLKYILVYDNCIILQFLACSCMYVAKWYTYPQFITDKIKVYL